MNIDPTKLLSWLSQPTHKHAASCATVNDYSDLLYVLYLGNVIYLFAAPSMTVKYNADCGKTSQIN